jgi:hypothetical protein
MQTLSSPIFTTDNFLNRRAADSKYPRSRFLGYARLIVQFSDIKDLLAAKFGPPVILPTRSNPAAFLFPVYRVCLRGSKEQVSRVYAGRIVASMKNPEPVGNRSDSYEPYRPMSRNVFSFWATRSRAVVSRCFATNPKPAVSGFTDPSPESLRERGRKPLLRQILGSNFDLHTVSVVDCLSRSRLVQTARGHFNFAMNNVFCKEAF